MTTADAAELWGISVARVITYCQKGMIPGAKKVMRSQWSHPRWHIPEGARMPKVKMGRPSLSAEINFEPYEDDEPTAQEVTEGELPDPTGVPPALYVWDHQDQPIKRLAGVLKVSCKRVTVLYDLAMKLYLK